LGISAATAVTLCPHTSLRGAPLHARADRTPCPGEAGTVLTCKARLTGQTPLDVSIVSMSYYIVACITSVAVSRLNTISGHNAQLSEFTASAESRRLTPHRAPQGHACSNTGRSSQTRTMSARLGAWVPATYVRWPRHLSKPASASARLSLPLSQSCLQERESATQRLHRDRPALPHVGSEL